MPNLFEIVLVLGLLWILGLWIWSAWTGQTALEPFQVGSGSGSGSGRGGPEPRDWSVSRTDKVARESQTCEILSRFDDEVLPQAHIELMSDTCEGGLPHTVGTAAIRITDKVWSEATAERRAEILRHERIHLLQRRFPEEWDHFYEQQWGYRTTLQPPANMPADTLEQTRGNPDTFPKRWACWRKRYWFVPTYSDCHNPNIHQADVRIWDAEKAVWLKEPPKEWMLSFCTEKGVCPRQLEHPAEIAAEYWTDVMGTAAEKWKTTPAAFGIRNFIQSLL
jgi:hypothetical protein